MGLNPVPMFVCAGVVAMGRLQVPCVCVWFLLSGMLTRPQPAGAAGTRDEDTRALFAAIRDGNLATVESLLQNKEIVNGKDKTGTTALMQAASSADAAIIRLLLDKGADPNARVEVSAPARDVFTPVMAAAMRGDMETLEQLLSAGGDVNLQGGDFGRSALLLAATTGSEEVVRLILGKGARVNVKDNRGDTPWNWASRRGEMKVVELIAKAGGGEQPRKDPGGALPRLHENPGAGGVKQAVSKSLQRLQRSGESFTKRKGCISCHQQSLVAMAVGLAQARFRS